MLEDNDKLRKNLTDIYDNPKLIIDDVAKASGRRGVYFAHFQEYIDNGDYQDIA